ncbi:hypothetical protein Aab01nite_69440 [Paractinoplanes abujensis]|nr:hypothetical protein Aab01nite_69440 [Actinoplanes abujensis]
MLVEQARTARLQLTMRAAGFCLFYIFHRRGAAGRRVSRPSDKGAAADRVPLGLADAIVGG